MSLLHDNGQCCPIIHGLFLALQAVAGQLAMNKKKAVNLLQHVAVVNLSGKIFKLWLGSARIASQSKKWFRVCKYNENMSVHEYGMLRWLSIWGPMLSMHVRTYMSLCS